MNKKLVFKSLRNTTCAVVYIFIVSQIMKNGEKLFGQDENIFVPFAFLILFSLSAAVVGWLIFGQSTILFLEGKKSEGVKAAAYSIGWLGIYAILGLLILLISN